MGSIRADELFVFAGAGISRDSGLPLFNEIRDGAVRQLGLQRYLQPADAVNRGLASVEILEGLAPEAFFHALEQSEVDVAGWLRVALGGGRPGRGHAVLSALAAAGAAVWTVNFDELIEATLPAPLKVSCWPDHPAPDATLLKPHGTLSGELIATAPSVLSQPADEWVARLKTDIDGRLAVFVGYSARDADFRPLWPDVLASSREVIWFDLPDVEEQLRKRRILRVLAEDGRTTFPVERLVGDEAPDPSRHFVNWIRDSIELDVPQVAVPPRSHAISRSLPPINLRSPFGPARFLERLGDAPGARRAYWRVGWRSPVGAVRGAAMVTINHGQRRTAAALLILRLMSDPLRRSTFNQWARRKEASIYNNLGQHSRVLDLTQEVLADDVSTLAILRSSSLRMTGSLDEASRVALDALARARREAHPARAANAAFQAVISSLWAYRLDECRAVLENDLEPLASLAANRWVAWSLVMRAALDARNPEMLDRTEATLDRAIGAFLTEGLIDGAISATISKSVALRAGDRAEAATRCLDAVSDLEQGSGVLYTRGHHFTEEVVSFERAELARRAGRLDDALPLYARVSQSRYPVNATLGLVGQSLVLRRFAEEYLVPASLARDLAVQIGAHYQRELAERLLNGGLPDSEVILFP
jgi:hypothetical protein